jgi:hypothetical protein
MSSGCAVRSSMTKAVPAYNNMIAAIRRGEEQPVFPRSRM